jgi:KDO2-lipid IV(A) lauroyltransferase
MSAEAGGGVAPYLEYVLVLAFAKALRYLPSSLAYPVGEGLGALAYRMDRKHRVIAQQNLGRAFNGQFSSEVIGELARSTFINLGRTVVETCRIPRIDRDNFHRLIRVEGYEHFLKAKERGRGVIYITAHLGSWELLPVASALMGEPLSIVARPLDNRYLDRAVNRLRTGWGTKVLAKKHAIPTLVRALHQGESIGILMDQHITWKEGVLVDFFGLPACTALAPALLALRTGAAVLPAAIFRRRRDRHAVVVGEEIPLIRTGNLKEDLVANTAAFTKAIEAFVRREPAQWLWVHRRWKVESPPATRATLGAPGARCSGGGCGAAAHA